MKITLRQLKRLGACEGQVNLFKEIFGTIVELTEAVVVEHGGKFDINWLADKVLTPKQLTDYQAKRALLWADYQAKCAPLWADFEAKHAPLRADYQAKCAPLWADFEAKRAPLWADYEAKHALIFWGIINFQVIKKGDKK